MELTISQVAEKQRQDSLNTVAIAKAYPDAKQTNFRGNQVYISGRVNTGNFRGIEMFVGQNNNFSKSVVSARLWHTVKRPGRDVIRVYSSLVYGLTLEHLVNVVNDMSPKSVMGKIGHVLKIQEANGSPVSRPKRVG